MRKLPKFDNGGDMLSSDKNAVRTKRIGNYQSEKKRYEAAAREAGALPGDDIYDRDMYRADKEINSLMRKQERVDGNVGGNGFSPKAASAISIGSQLGGAAVDVMKSSGLKVDENSAFEQQQAVGDALMAIPSPYTQIAGIALKAGSALDQAMGTNLNTISKNDAKEAGISTGARIANNVLSFLPTGG